MVVSGGPPPASDTRLKRDIAQVGEVESYRRILVMSEVRRQRLELRYDDLDSVVELYTEDNFRQLVVAAETMPTFLGGLCELEDHGERGLV